MSKDVRGGLDYALTKRHYDADDSVTLVVNGVVLLNGIPFLAAAPTYYVVGLMAYINDVNVPDFERGWTLFAHGQAAAPAWLAPFLAALGITTWPAELPSFEAKDLLFYSDVDCFVQFEGLNRVRHFIPANTFMRFHRRCFMFWVQGVAANGTLRCWIEG